MRLAALLAIAVLSCYGQGGVDAITALDLRADLTFLTSKPLEGRMSLQRGSDVAIEWIVSEFKKARLTPAAGTSFLEPVPLIEYRPDRDASSLTIVRTGKREPLRFPDAFGNFPEDCDVSAPLAFAGYGITAPELHYDDYAGLDAHGKIVLLFDHEPQETDPHSIFNGTGNTRYATSRVKLLNAQNHGAIGVLMMAEPNRKHPSSQERAARVTPASVRAGRFPSQAIVADELHIPLYNLSDRIAAQLLAPLGKPSDLQSSIDANLHPASALIPGTKIEIHNVNRERRVAITFNVSGMIEGSDPALRLETVIYSAHFDHNGPAGNNAIYPGADDNGSGTVGVVELARAFTASHLKPRRTLMFVVFAAEERGLLGSYYYVQHPQRPLASTRAVINFDMIGRNEAPSEQTKGLIEIAPDTSNEMNLVGARYSPEYRKVVERANQQTGLHLNYKWDDEASLNVFFRSDQFPFTLQNIPAMWWFTGFHPDYHQTTDTVDRINFDKMVKILKLAYLSGWEFAQTSDPPKFIANPSAGM